MTISSISFSQEEILGWISQLHNDSQPFECDCTYGLGCFYKSFPEPKYKLDIQPRLPGVISVDSRCLPFASNSLKSIVFDPPFLAGPQRNGIMKSRFGLYKNIPELWKYYESSLQEFHRALKPGGLLVFKCQDTVESGHNYFSHCYIQERASAIGFESIDLFILLAKHRMVDKRTQKHARKFHSYFWVMRKI